MNAVVLPTGWSGFEVFPRAAIELAPGREGSRTLEACPGDKRSFTGGSMIKTVCLTPRAGDIDVNRLSSQLRFGKRLNYSRCIGLRNFHECAPVHDIDCSDRLTGYSRLVGYCADDIAGSDSILPSDLEEKARHARLGKQRAIH